MYGKLFRQMYRGTLATVGPWEALITFQQFIILADSEGIVDMTVASISRETTIPINILKIGIDALERPDPESRSPAEEGRRIVRLDDHRSWGWRIVNYAQYRALRREEDRREYHRQYYHTRKLNTTQHAQPIQPIAYAEAEAKTENLTTLSGNPPKTRKLNTEARAILAFLNEKTGRRYQPVPANLRLIAARLTDGATAAECRQVIAKKSREWKSNPDMAEYLRPATLFNATKFAQYQGELVAHKEPEWSASPTSPSPAPNATSPSSATPSTAPAAGPPNPQPAEPRASPSQTQTATSALGSPTASAASSPDPSPPTPTAPARTSAASTPSAMTETSAPSPAAPPTNPAPTPTAKQANGSQPHAERRAPDLPPAWRTSAMLTLQAAQQLGITKPGVSLEETRKLIQQHLDIATKP